jgi:2-oxoglutarate ferredoxin oxidoreductase subunit alpha
MPTKTEQSDLLQVMFGRNGEAPVPVVAACTPSDCFHAAIEAARIALKYRTPVVLLSDGYLANGSEPWLIPEVASLPDIPVGFATEPNHDGDFWPYLRDEATLARPWALPGTPGLEHRIGGLEKADGSGNISYDPQDGASLLVLGWGSTYGPIGAAVRRVRAEGGKVAQAHLRHLNPFPANLGEVLGRYQRVLIPEMNLGQLRRLVRAEFLVDAVGYNRVRGLPFKSEELADAIIGLLDEGASK